MPRLSTLVVAAATLVAAITMASACAAQDQAALAKASHDAGMKAAPATIAANHLPCTLTDARLTGNLKDAKGATATITEVACKEGIGFVIVAVDKPPSTNVYDCLIANQPGPNGKPTPIACVLPENKNASGGAQYMVTQAGRSCSVSKARFIGMTPDGRKLYEAACGDGQGFIVEVAASAWATATASNCLAYADNPSVKCTLTTSEQNLSVVSALAAKSGKCATLTKSRYVLSTQDGSDYFEIACSDGKGYMLQDARNGSLHDTIPCVQAYAIGNGCTLTDTKQAETQEAATYTTLAKEAGFDCKVSKYALFPQSNDKQDIVEMACSNRDDGAVGVFPGSGKGVVYDCIRAQLYGYACTYTQMSADFPMLNATLKAVNKGSCVVSSARPLGHGEDGSDYIEVGCADGDPGWVMIYPPGAREPKQLMNCAQAAGLGGGCQLPGNKKKG